MVVLILFGGNLYLLRSQKNSPANQPPLPSSTVILTSPAPIDPTANWKTYASEELGYFISYPENNFKNCGTNGEFFLFEGGGEECALGEEPTEFYIKKFEPSRIFYQNSENNDCYKVETENILVGGLSAKKYTNRFIKGTAECQSFPISTLKGAIYILIDRKVQPLEIYFNETRNKDIKNQILSTFRFVK